MNLTEATEFIHAASWRGSCLGLERITELMARLGDPQRELRFIHVAGTNGKGSVCAMLASVLTRAGYRTGLYTSPHLFRVNERIKVDGADVSDAELTELAALVKPAADSMADPPTEFERITAMALLYFARRRCDAVVLEVGLGGRLDSTNVIGPPEAAVVTDLSLEHTAVLGDTLEQIAGEKAGIIKPGASVVLSAQSAEAENVIRRRCAELGCSLRVTEPQALRLRACGLFGQTLDYRDRRELRLCLSGSYQLKNAAAALDTVDVLRERGWAVPEEAVRAGLAETVWPARFEVLQTQPLVLVDGAHNPAGAAELSASLSACLPGRKLTMVMGVMADKDHSDMIRTLAPHAADFVTVTPESERALPARELAERIRSLTGLPVRCGGSVRDGLALALEGKGPDGAVCAFGSLYQAGEVRAYFGKA